jgi:hypothetical protein
MMKSFSQQQKSSFATKSPHEQMFMYRNLYNQGNNEKAVELLRWGKANYSIHVIELVTLCALFFALIEVMSNSMNQVNYDAEYLDAASKMLLKDMKKAGYPVMKILRGIKSAHMVDEQFVNNIMQTLRSKSRK